MFYISSIENIDRKIGITDTSDGVEEFYTNQKLYDIIKNKKVQIYGTSVFNKRVDCTVLTPDVRLEIYKLNQLLNDWRKLHNPWTGVPVEDYLACVSIGTHLIVHYEYSCDGSRRLESCVTNLTKIDDDKWLFEDKSNTFSGRVGNSRFAASMLEVACIYSKLKYMKVEE